MYSITKNAKSENRRNVMFSNKYECPMGSEANCNGSGFIMENGCLCNDCAAKCSKYKRAHSSSTERMTVIPKRERPKAYFAK